MYDTRTTYDVYDRCMILVRIKMYDTHKII